MARTRRLFNSRTAPASILAALIAFGGCSPANPYWADQKPFAEAAAASFPAMNDNEVWIRPIQIRRSYNGQNWIDLVVAGKQAERAALKWADTPRGSTVINAVLTLRRVTPDPAPIKLTTDGDLGTLARYPGHGEGWQKLEGDTPSQRMILSIPFSASPDLVTGRYELRMVVPSMAETAVWDVSDLIITLDQNPVQFQLNE